MTRGNPHAHGRELLTRVALNPGDIVGLEAPDLDLFIRLARRSRILGRICTELDELELLDNLPQVAADQMVGARIQAESRSRLALWELDRIARAVKGKISYPLVAMKGCAYILIESQNAKARLFADVDLMVPESEIEKLEALLHQSGWQSAELSPYDDNYYRNWTHELPPMMHTSREVEIDLHFNIVPRTSRFVPDASALLAKAQPVDGSSYSVPCNEDIVLHAATHLMISDDMADKFRDLLGIHDLVVEFVGRDPDFLNSLIARADELGLRRPAYYALRYIERLLRFDMPPAIAASIADWGPPRPVLWLMDKLVPAALYPWHPDHRSRRIDLCRLLLYIRSHWIRMPPWLLFYHLSYKFYLTRIRRVRKPG